MADVASGHMVTGHVQVTTHKRSLGHSVYAAFGYRGGLALRDPRTGIVHDFTSKQRFGDIGPYGIESSRPSPITKSFQILADAIEASERRSDSRILRDVHVAHIVAVDEATCTRLTKQLAGKMAVRHDTVAPWFVHPPGEGDDRNWHSHILLPTRALSEDGTGFGKKLTVLDNQRTSGKEVAWIRNAWADDANGALAEQCKEATTIRMGPRLDAPPDITLGQAVTAMERRGARDAGIDAAGMSIRELLRTIDPVTERGKDAKEVLLERDDSDPRYGLYSRSNIDRWIEKKVRARDQGLADALDEWAGEMPSIVEEIQTAKQARAEDASAEDVDEPMHEPDPLPEKTQATDEETAKPKPDRQPRGRMSPEERRARREQRGRGKGRTRRQRRRREETTVVTMAALEKHVAREEALPEVEPARALQSPLQQLGTPDSKSDAAEIAEPMVGTPSDDEVHRVDHDPLVVAIAELNHPEHASPRPDGAVGALDVDENRIEDQQFVAALADLEPDENPRYRAYAWDLNEWQDRVAAQIDAGEIELVREPEPVPSFDSHDLEDHTAAQIDSGEIEPETDRAPKPGWVQEDQHDHAAQIIDHGEIEPERDATAIDTSEDVPSPRPEPQLTFDPYELEDSIAARIDWGDLLDEPDYTPPWRAEIDLAAIERDVRRTIGEQMAKLTEQDGDDDAEQFTVEIHQVIDEALAYLRGTETRPSLAVEADRAIRRRIEGAASDQEPLWLQWTPIPGKPTPVRSEASARVAARETTRIADGICANAYGRDRKGKRRRGPPPLPYWHRYSLPERHHRRQRQIDRTVGTWTVSAIGWLARIVAAVVLREVEQWRQERHRVRMGDEHTRNRGPGMRD